MTRCLLVLGSLAVAAHILACTAPPPPAMDPEPEPQAPPEAPPAPPPEPSTLAEEEPPPPASPTKPAEPEAEQVPRAPSTERLPVSQWEPPDLPPQPFDPRAELRSDCSPAGTVHIDPLPEAAAQLPWQRGQAMKYGADYEAFVTRAREHTRPKSQEALEAMLDKLAGPQPVTRGEKPPPPTAPELQAKLIEGLGMGFLLDGLEQRPLSIQPGPGPGWAEGRQLNIVMNDPYVGTMELLLVLPDGRGPWPAVVAHPGHFEDAHYHRQFRFGADFAAAGIALAILTPRANDSHPLEDKTSQLFLRNGFTFMGVRVYELLLVRKYLRCRTDIQADRLGLVGHSGGAVVGNLAVRVERSWKAYVGDLTGDYLNWDVHNRTALDETAPAVYPLHPYVNKFTTSEVPTLMLPYEFGPTGEVMIDFFKKHL
ncbi:MAG: hypothetical protein VX498_15415 [Myxococcota bacterium]|nr:hypothetical protein [Myxococcota bacterium]